MSFSSATGRYGLSVLAAAAAWVGRTLLSGILVSGGLVTVFLTFATSRLSPGLQMGIIGGATIFSLLMFAGLATSASPGRKSWLAVHAGIMLMGLAAVWWVPDWAAWIVGGAFLLFVPAPHALHELARRCASDGDMQAAADYARLAGLLHPSREFRDRSAVFGVRVPSGAASPSVGKTDTIT